MQFPGIDASCSPTDVSDHADFNVAPSVFVDTFEGKVTAPGDSSNSWDIDGVADYDPDMDWLRFDNAYRAWGIDAPSPFPDYNNPMYCCAGVCRIWDWRISSDSLLAGTPFLPDAPCPLEVRGDEVLQDLAPAAHNNYLANALELLGDYIGDDDGLPGAGGTTDVVDVTMYGYTQ
jgi:hypothetical protein